MPLNFREIKNWEKSGNLKTKVSTGKQAKNKKKIMQRLGVR